MDTRKNLFRLERLINRTIAKERDAGICAICYFDNKGLKVKASEVHHTEGRSRSVGTYKENYRKLICLCNKCHRKIHDGLINKEHVEGVLELANLHPINKSFRHEE